MAAISNEFSFKSKTEQSSISKYQKCLELYENGFDEIKALKGDFPIFLDTNILLRYYSISFVAREKLFKFISEYSSRIILTSQVQKEFIKNRESIINDFFNQVTGKIPTSFQSEVINKMQTFINVNKIVLKDYPKIEIEINKQIGLLNDLLKELEEESEKSKKENENLTFQDDFLKLLNNCELLDSLEDGEIDLVKKDFNSLSNGITSDKVNSTIENKPNCVIPGLGDIKEKPEDPYGDFIIYHEMLKYMKEKSTNIAFLTFDSTKGDWMLKDKRPHTHYITNTYDNTGNLLYILDAERLLSDILDINIESLLKDKEKEIEDSLSIDDITNLMQNNPIFKNREFKSCPEYILRELKLFGGYKHINEVIEDAIKGDEMSKARVIRTPNHFNTIGLLRHLLQAANTNYIRQIVEDGKIYNMREHKYEDDNFIKQ